MSQYLRRSRRATEGTLDKLSLDASSSDYGKGSSLSKHLEAQRGDIVCHFLCLMFVLFLILIKIILIQTSRKLITQNLFQ